MSGGSVVTYRRGLAPFQTYQLNFWLAGSDAHWNYMRFEFRTGDALHAAGYMKGAAVSRNGLVPNERSDALMGIERPLNPLPPAVEHWLAAERAIIEP
jgi:hypothetical protein